MTKNRSAKSFSVEAGVEKTAGTAVQKPESTAGVKTCDALRDDSSVLSDALLAEVGSVAATDARAYRNGRYLILAVLLASTVSIAIELPVASSATPKLYAVPAGYAQRNEMTKSFDVDASRLTVKGVCAATDPRFTSSPPSGWKHSEYSPTCGSATYSVTVVSSALGEEPFSKVSGVPTWRHVAPSDAYKRSMAGLKPDPLTRTGAAQPATTSTVAPTLMLYTRGATTMASSTGHSAVGVMPT